MKLFTWSIRSKQLSEEEQEEDDVFTGETKCIDWKVDMDKKID